MAQRGLLNFSILNSTAGINWRKKRKSYIYESKIILYFGFLQQSDCLFHSLQSDFDGNNRDGRYYKVVKIWYLEENSMTKKTYFWLDLFGEKFEALTQYIFSAVIFHLSIDLPSTVFTIGHHKNDTRCIKLGIALAIRHQTQHAMHVLAWYACAGWQSCGLSDFLIQNLIFMMANPGTNWI